MYWAIIILIIILSGIVVFSYFSLKRNKDRNTDSFQKICHKYVKADNSYSKLTEVEEKYNFVVQKFDNNSRSNKNELPK